MKANRILGTGIVALSLFAWVGCQPSQEEMAAMMKQPPRPAELDRLEAFVGNWKAEVEVQMPGSDETYTSHGSNSSQWAVDKWMLVEHWEHEFGEGNMMKGISLMWWDANARKYRTSWTDNYGGRGKGTLIYDEKEETWKGKYKTRDGKSGDRTVAEWTGKFTDPSTLEWTWTEWDGLKLFKIVEVSGRSRRQ